MVTPNSVIDTKILDGITCYLQAQISPKEIWEIERALPTVNKYMVYNAVRQLEINGVVQGERIKNYKVYRINTGV
jgi:Fe2+ or Zn2+ uptake regulation protein